MTYKVEALSPYETLSTGFNKTKAQSNKKSKRNTQGISYDILLLFISFFLGRGVVMNDLSPFVFAFFSYILATKKNKTWILWGGILGLCTVQNLYYIVRGVLVLGTMFYAMGKMVTPKTKPWKASLIGSLCLFTVGIIGQWIIGNNVYSMLLLAFESVTTFILFFIYRSAIPLIIGRTARKVVSNEELISSGILISLTLLGMGELSIYGYSIKNILGIGAILIFSANLGSGAGAIIGIVVGVVTSLNHLVAPSIIGVYAFSGLLSGVFKDLGKIPVALGFILANASLTFYINGSTQVFISIEEILIAVLVLLLSPRRLEERISSFKGIVDYRVQREKMYGERVREVTIDRLMEYSKVFDQIGKSFEQAAVSKTLIGQKDISEVFDRVAQEVCCQCSFYSKCWKKDFYNTYNNMLALLEKIDKCNSVQSSDIPEKLKQKCLQPERITQVMAYLYEIYKSNQFWEKQMMENKNLVSQQLRGISDVIHDLGKDMKNQIIFKKEEEEEILVGFDRKDIHLKDVMVLEDGQGKYEVTLYAQTCYGEDNYRREMAEIISQVLGKKMIIDQHICQGKELEERCKVTFKEAMKYSITTGVVRVSKDPKEESGDSYSSISLNEGKHMLALSDGMGSGKRAAVESKTTINLLEHFLEAGFNREIALKTINSILMLRSSDEMFSTIDLSIIDQYSGETEFIKIGAVSTFIKRGQEVEMIASNTLPVGILDEVNIEVSKKKLKDGDIVIMVTDGLLDAKPLVKDKERWVQEKIKDIKSKNPQRIARALLDQAKNEKSYGFEDDTTILVAKVWENK